jgi:hypothetical protein
MGAADRLLETVSGMVMPPVSWIRDRYFDAVKASLGGTSFDTALAEGRAMTLANAIALAQRQVPLNGRLTSGSRFDLSARFASRDRHSNTKDTIRSIRAPRISLSAPCAPPDPSTCTTTFGSSTANRPFQITSKGSQKRVDNFAL